MTEISNRKAFHLYSIETTYTAGIVLNGPEVKSIRQGQVSFNDSYCLIDDHNEIWLKSLYIAPYSNEFFNEKKPDSDRKLLLEKKEINKIRQKFLEKGYTLIPLKIFNNEHNLIKIIIGLGKGKKLVDKRLLEKTKEVTRDINRKYKL
ncbi:MAG: SsrA-binding protein SmpB [Sediminibacterium sp.]|nr:SsrA-binding protein SmpB [Sediminibacterium sp.]